MSPAKRPKKADALEQVRRICLALPEVTERLSHGTPTWFVKDKKTFVQFWVDGHHDLEYSHLWMAAPPGVQEELIGTEPERFFRPPYVGHRGWVGVRMDRSDIDWDELAAMAEEAYRTVAPAKLIAQLDNR